MDSRLKALALIGLLPLLLASCSGGPAATQPAAQPGTTASAGVVTIQGFAFDPVTLTVKVGISVT